MEATWNPGIHRSPLDRLVTTQNSLPFWGFTERPRRSEPSALIFSPWQSVILPLFLIGLGKTFDQIFFSSSGGELSYIVCSYMLSSSNCQPCDRSVETKIDSR
ncbi:unnamed protein product [Musa textilis]